MERFVKRGKMNDSENRFKQEIHSKVIRAGKRTYFFDVKSTRNDEYYLTMTESKKRFESEGKFHYEKHKIFLYKEDFDKFADSLQEVINFIKENQPGDKHPEETISDIVKETITDDFSGNKTEHEVDEVEEKDYTNVEFEDLTS